MVVGTVTREIAKAQEIMTLFRGKDFAGAAALARAASAEFPAYLLPAQPGQPRPTFAQMAMVCDMHAQAQVPAPAAAAEPAQVKAEKSAPKVTTAVLRLVHDGEQPTSIYGVEKDSPAQKAIGSKKGGGLGWWWFPKAAAFYIPKSGGFAPDMGAISTAIARLEAIKVDGVQLYRVESQISTVGPDGAPLAVKMTADQRQAWQRKVDGLRNDQKWNLSRGAGVCSECGVTGLTARTGKSVRGGDGLPVVKCYTCNGDPAPAAESAPLVDLGAMLALPAAPAPAPEVAPEAAPALSKAERKAAKKARKAARLAAESAPAPAPAPAPEAAPAPAPAGDSLVGKVWRFAMAEGLSGMKRNEVATDVRRDLNARVVSNFPGMKVEVRRDKAKHQLVLTVLEGPEDSESVNARDLTTMVVGTVLTVQGVARRMTAPRA